LRPAGALVSDHRALHAVSMQINRPAIPTSSSTPSSATSSTSSLSPGQALRAKTEEFERQQAFHALTRALLNDVVSGDAVTQLHQQMSGTADERNAAVFQLQLLESLKKLSTERGGRPLGR
jgi:hypothetical protein